MSRILVSGLVNVETTVQVRQFPVPYYPIDYPFFGVRSAVSGVGFNIAKALATLGDEVTLTSLTGSDFAGSYIRKELEGAGVSAAHVRSVLRETPASAVLYDGEGRRQIYCDLKDIQDATYDFPDDVCQSADFVVACNINFSRRLLHLAKAAGKPIATDVHVLRDIDDGYNREFMQHAHVLFLSDEGVGEDYRPFLTELARVYPAQILVIGRGGKGAAMYLRSEGRIFDLPAANAGPVVNTVGAGDALFSAFIHDYARGLHPLAALRRAQLFAARKIGVSGASKGFCSQAELDALDARQG